MLNSRDTSPSGMSIGFLEVLGIFVGVAGLATMTYYGCLWWGLREIRQRRELAQPLMVVPRGESIATVEY
jgi:hypothetical protein